MSPSKTPSFILLVDDNRMGLAARKTVLEELGYRTLTATSAHAALELFAKNEFDLVVTDYKMPDMSGIELIQKLRQQESRVPIILISGFAEVLGLDEETTGADVVMTKNAQEVNALVRAVSRLLKPSRKPPVSTKVEVKSRKKSG
jgi:CheY-like chemotaxis protein